MKNAQITQAIATQLAAGADIETAINTVFGAGAYQKVASLVYDMLRANAD